MDRLGGEEAQPGINRMGGGTVISAHVVIKPRRTAAKPAKETMIITCSGMPLKTRVIILAGPDDQSKRRFYKGRVE
jgi:hypothetical protein